MAKPKGKDMTARPIQIGDLTFDDRFRVGGAMYIENATGRSFLDVAEEMSAESDKPRIATLAKVLTALYLQRNDQVPVDVAEKAVATLDLNQMMQVMSQINLELEEKNSISPEVDLTETAKATPGQ